MEKAAFLVPVQGLPARVGERGPNPALSGQFRGIEVEDDLFGRDLVRLEEQVDEQPFDRRAGVPDLVVARRLGRRVLEPVQRALAGKRRASLAPGTAGR